MKKILYPAIVALALLGSSSAWAAFPVLGAKGVAVAKGAGAVAVVVACALVADHYGDDEHSASTTTTTRTK
ncbi:hypothetical protein Z042_09655 [Chania multitudinisentens RB-25]|uniref:Uncharacterized protein n=1 Tax=Chania multitudinisentens RB-25 TaxID=1441930 RepID=W0LJX7_9GAMM|nr:hypothetical protein [Chania multitudinisentens]AHG22734.1 hypothetical protein Z042_09655 [Chania multitudinisentens RB-25]